MPKERIKLHPPQKPAFSKRYRLSVTCAVPNIESCYAVVYFPFPHEYGLTASSFSNNVNLLPFSPFQPDCLQYPESFPKNLHFYVSGCSIFHVNNPNNYMYLAANPHSTICCPRDLLPQKQRFELKCSICNNIYSRFESHFHDFARS